MGRQISGIYTTSRQENSKEYFRQSYLSRFKNEHSTLPLIYCEHCKYETRNKMHWKNHLKTTKHKINSGNINFLD